MQNTAISNVEVTEDKCHTCKGMAETRLLKINHANLPSEVISIFECKNCNIRETNVFEYNDRRQGRVKITCCIDTKEDLQRYIYLSQDAKVAFYDDDSNMIYEFKKFSSEIVVIEILLVNTIDKIANFYGIDLEKADGLCQAPESVDATAIKEAGVSSKERALAAEKIKLLKKEIENPKFRMVVTDSSGTSRVGPPGHDLPSDFATQDFEFYNDEKVKHCFKY